MEASKLGVLTKIAKSAEWSDHPLDLNVSDFKLLAEAYLYEHDQTPLTRAIFRASGFKDTLGVVSHPSLPDDWAIDAEDYRECRILCGDPQLSEVGRVYTVGDIRRVFSAFGIDIEIVVPKEESTNA